MFKDLINLIRILLDQTPSPIISQLGQQIAAEDRIQIINEILETVTAIYGIIDQKEKELLADLRAQKEEKKLDFIYDENDFLKKSKHMFLVSKDVVYEAWKRYRPKS